MSLAAPTIYFPEDPTDHDGRSACLILDLGHTSVASFPVTANLDEKRNRLGDIDHAVTDARVDSQVLSDFYDSLEVKVQKVNVYLEGDKISNQLVHPFDVNLSANLSMFPFEPQLPMFVCFGSLPSLSVQMTSSAFRKLFRLLEAVGPAYDKGAAGVAAPLIEEENEDGLGVDVEKASEVNSIDFAAIDQKQREFESRKTFAVVNIALPEISFSLLDDSSKPGEKREMVSCKVLGVQADLAVRKSYVEAFVALNGVFVEDCFGNGTEKYLVHTTNPETVSLTDSKPEEPLNFIAVKFVMVSPDHPNYQNVDIEFVVDVGYLTANSNPDTLLTLLRFWEKEMAPESLPEIAVSSQKSSRLSSIGGDASSAEKSVVKKKETASKLIVRDARTTFKMSATFRKLQVRLNAKTTPLAEMFIAGFQVDFAMYEKSLDLRLVLCETVMKDCTPKGEMYRDVIRTINTDEDPYLIDFTFATFNEEEVGYPGVSSKMVAVIGGMQFTFLMRFVDELLKYMFTGPANQLIFGDSSEPPSPKTSTDSVKSSEVKAVSNETADFSESFPEIELYVSRMALFIPVSSTGQSQLAMSVSLSLRADPQPLNQCVVMQLSDFKGLLGVGSIHGGSESEGEATDFMSMGECKLTFTDEMKVVDVEIPSFSVILGRTQYLFLMDLIGQNLLEQAEVVPKIYKCREEKRVSVAHKLESRKIRDSAMISISSDSPRAQMGEATLRVSFRIESFSAELRKLSGRLDEHRLVTCAFQTLRGGLDMYDSGAMGLELGFMNLDMCDNSVDSISLGIQKEFLSVLSIFSKNKQEPFAASMRIHPLTGMDISLTMESVRICFGGILWSLLAYFQLPAAPEALAIEEVGKEGAIVDLGDYLAADSSTVGSTHLEFSLASFEIHVIRNPVLQRSSGISMKLSLGADFKMSEKGGIKLEADVRGITANAVIIDLVDGLKVEPLSSAAVLEPMTCIIQLESKKSCFVKGQFSYVGSVHVDHVTGRLTVLDMQLVFSALEAMTPPSLGEETWEGEPTEDVPERKYHEQRILIENSELGKMHLFASDAESGGSLMSYPEIDVSLGVAGVAFVLVNDAGKYDLPVIRMTVQTLCMSVNAFKHNLFVDTELKTSGEYYSERFDVWEPLLEPWACKFLLNMTETTSNLDVRSDKIVDINITYAIMKTVSSTLRLMNELQDSDSLAIDQPRGGIRWSVLGSTSDKHNTHAFLNLTEIDLDLIIDADEVRVEAGATVGVSAAKWAAFAENRRSSVTESQATMTADLADIAIVFVDGPWAPIRHVSLVNPRSHFLRSTKAGHVNLLLVTEPGIIDGQRCLQLHSQVHVYNHCSVALEACGSMIYPDTGIWMPALRSREDTFVFRPCASITEDSITEDSDSRSIPSHSTSTKSKQGDSKPNPTHKFSSRVRLLGAKPESSLNYCEGLDGHTQMNFSIQVQLNHVLKSVEFHIYPQILFHNVLPGFMMINLKEGKKVNHIQLKRGQRTGLLHASVDSSIVSISIPNYGCYWEGQVPISQIVQSWRKGGLDDNFAHKVKLIDDAGNILPIFVAPEYPLGKGGGSLSLSFYVEYWIFDLTNLSLMVSEDKQRVCGGHSKLNRENASIARQSIINPTKPSARCASMFGFADTHEHRHHRIFVRSARYDWLPQRSSAVTEKTNSVGKSSWSSHITVEAAGSHAIVEGMRASDKGRCYRYGVSVKIHHASGWFYRTKVITFKPRFVLRNDMDVGIEYKQPEMNAVIVLRPGQSAVFHPIFPADSKELDSLPRLMFRKCQPGWEWSCPMHIGLIGEMVFRLAHRNKIHCILSLQVVPVEGAISVIINYQYTQFSPFRIVNRTLSTPFSFCQLGVFKWTEIEPGYSMAGAWDDPERKKSRKLIIRVGGDSGRQYTLDIMNKSKFHSIGIPDSKRKMYPQINRSHGPSTIFSIWDFGPDSPPEERKETAQIITRELDHQNKAISQKIQHLRSELENFKRSDRKEDKPTLFVTIIYGRDLRAGDLWDSDPYCRVSVDGLYEQRTSVKSNTVDPRWNERFAFPAGRRPVTLRIQIFNKNTFRRDNPLGNVTINLPEESLNVYNEDCDAIAKTFEIEPASPGESVSGTLYVRLQYVYSMQKALQTDIDRLSSEFNSVGTYLIKSRMAMGQDPAWAKRGRMKNHGQVDDVEAIVRISVGIDELTYLPVLPAGEGSLFLIVSVADKEFRIPLKSIKNNGQLCLGATEDFYLKQSDSENKDFCLSLLLLRSNTLFTLAKYTTPLSYIKCEDDEKKSDNESEEITSRWELLHVMKTQFSRTFSEANPQVLLSLKRSSPFPRALRPQVAFRVDLMGAGISLVDAKMVELIYGSVKGIQIKFEDSLQQQTVQFCIEKFQVDSQGSGMQFPIVLTPTPVSPDLWQPFLQMCINRSKTFVANVNIMVFQYFTFLMQEIDIQIEMDLMWQLLEFSMGLVEAEGLEQDMADSQTIDTVVRDRSSIFNDDSSVRISTQLFVKFLQLQPIAVNFSFVPAGGSLAAHFAGKIGLSPAVLVLKAAVVAIGKIDSAPINLNALVVENATGTAESLITPIITHYTYQGMRQWYRVMGSIDMIGNPVQLASNLGDGLSDFFYKPAQGLVKSPNDFAIGVSEGTISLLKHTLSGIFGAASKISESVAGGLLTLSTDGDYRQKRQARLTEHRIEHVGDGVVQGAASVGLGFFHGITGIVADPIRGARSSGGLGALKGVGTGLLGIITKPVSGVFDAASQTFEGIAKTPDAILSDGGVRGSEKVREPRFVGSHGLSVYDENVARAQELLLRVIRRHSKQFSAELEGTFVTDGGSSILMWSPMCLVFAKMVDSKIDMTLGGKGVSQKSAKLFIWRNLVRAYIDPENPTVVLLEQDKSKKNQKRTSNICLEVQTGSEYDADLLVSELTFVLDTKFPVIQSAFLGVRDRWLDCTDMLVKHFRSKSFQEIDESLSYDKLFGFDPNDPNANLPKVLIVSYSHSGSLRERVFFEGEPIMFD
eukprot:849119_1